MRSFVYGEPPFPVCADSLYILKHILPEQIFVIVFAICVVGASNERPYRLVQTITILRSGIFSFLLYKLSSRMKILTFGGNWIII